MCKICMSDPCVETCPNYGRKVIAKCKICFNNICDDEQYAEIDGDCYHLDCLEDDLTVKELIEMCGGEIYPKD